MPTGNGISTSPTLTSKNLNGLHIWIQHEYNESYFSVFCDDAAI